MGSLNKEKLEQFRRDCPSNYQYVKRGGRIMVFMLTSENLYGSRE